MLAAEINTPTAFRIAVSPHVYNISIKISLSVLFIFMGSRGQNFKKNRSAAPPRKKNSIATMHQVYIYGAW